MVHTCFERYSVQIYVLNPFDPLLQLIALPSTNASCCFNKLINIIPGVTVDIYAQFFVRREKNEKKMKKRKSKKMKKSKTKMEEKKNKKQR